MNVPANHPLVLNALADGRLRPDQLPGGEAEADFQERVIALARSRGWLVAHFRAVRVQRADGSVYFETPAAADGAGFPDLVLAKAGRPVVLAELKSAAGAVRPAQKQWHDTLRAAGADVRVWRPSDWAEIVEVLT